MRKFNLTRRNLLGGIMTSLAGIFAVRSARAASLTPRATEGPFYPTPGMRRTDVDNDLVKIIGRVQDAGGKVLTLKGTVTDKDGVPRKGLRVEIWQCDMNGKYLHTGDTRGVTYDEGFQGFGHDITGPDGRYQFRTIRPGKYPGRTPHIHVKVLDGGQELLTTQFYEDENPENQRDSLFRRMSDTQANAVSMSYHPTDEGDTTTVNIVV